MLSERCCCSLSEKSLSSCYCWHRCCLLTAQVQVQVQVQVLALALALALALVPKLAPKLWR
jgi:hypothetical protein